MSPDGLQDMKDFLANTATPYGIRLAPQKLELIWFHRIGTLDKSQLPVIKLGDNTYAGWKTFVVNLLSCFVEQDSTIGPC